MPIGPGKYDEETTYVREKTDAHGVIVAVFKGNKGTGFSAQLTPAILGMVPQVLRDMADQIEKSKGL